jgi:hypothetical protein
MQTHVLAHETSSKLFSSLYFPFALPELGSVVADAVGCMGAEFGFGAATV